jgi:hypothetical protein
MKSRVANLYWIVSSNRYKLRVDSPKWLAEVQTETSIIRVGIGHARSLATADVFFPYLWEIPVIDAIPTQEGCFVKPVNLKIRIVEIDKITQLPTRYENFTEKDFAPTLFDMPCSSDAVNHYLFFVVVPRLLGRWGVSIPHPKKEMV